MTVEHGNEEKRFAVKMNSSEVREQAKSKPPPRVFKNVTLHGEVIILIYICHTIVGRLYGIYMAMNKWGLFI